MHDTMSPPKNGTLGLNSSDRYEIYVVSSAGADFRDVLLQTLANARNDESSTFLLKQCIAALEESLQRLEKLCPEEYREYALDAVMMPLVRATDILRGQAELPEHLTIPLCGPLLCVYQLLQLLPCVEQTQSKHAEAIGICLGMLPATVFACAKDRYDFIRWSVEATKLSFWVALRAEERRRNSQHAYDSHCLAVRGSPESVVPHLGQAYISAVRNDQSISLSGPPDALRHIQEELSPRVASSLPIFGLYHDEKGGKDVVEQVHEDMQREGILFPSFERLVLPLRSSATGKSLTESQGDLGFEVLRHIFSSPVDWPRVIKEYAKVGMPTNLAIVSVGPGASFAADLVTEIPSAHLVLAHELHPPSNDADLIAVVGMACRLPGASTPDELWEVLFEQKNMVAEVPPSRFDVDKYYLSPDKPLRPNTMRTKWGNFVKEEEFAAFDRQFFSISAREAETMDPQQRMLLHVAYEALEDSGYVPDATPSNNRNTFGCFVGMVTDDYVQNNVQNVDVYHAPGTLRAFSSGRISHHFGWKGINNTYDTACASSASALHAAVRSLESGDSNAALVSGVHLVTGPIMYVALDRAHFLSPTGQSKPFDAGGDGYCRAEGCVTVVLKRLRDALRDGDRVHGVLRACEVASNAHPQSITRPDATIQSRLIEKVCRVGNVKPSEVTVIEAHAAGTQAGDPTEVTAVLDSLMDGRELPIHMTSIKGNLGHTEPASGLAALVKILLMMKHGLIPGQVGLKTLNPAFPPYDPSLLQISRSSYPWIAPRRLALINNFGAAGTIGTILVEEWKNMESRSLSVDHASGPRLVVLSAHTKAALSRMQERLASACLTSPIRLSDISFTTSLRRIHHKYRLAFQASSKEDLTKVLQEVREPHVVPDAASPVVFCFSGQGLPVDKAQLLFTQSRAYRKAMEQCMEAIGVLKKRVPNVPEMRELHQLFAVEYALYHMWTAWGLKAVCLTGHSFGEYVAACVSGAMRLEDTLLLLSIRLELMLARGTRGTGMLAVRLNPDTELGSITAGFPSVSVSCYNTSNNVTLGGKIEELQALAEAVQTNGKGRATVLDVPLAFHSPAVDSILGDLKSAASAITYRPSKSVLVSAMSGEALDLHTPDYWVSHCRQPVKFVDAVNTIRTKHPEAVWLELGPRRSAVTFIKGSPALPSFEKDSTPWTGILKALGRLFELGVPINWTTFHSDTDTQGELVSLPHYPFQKEKLYKDHTAKDIATDTATYNRPATSDPSENTAPPGRTSIINFDPYQECIRGHRLDGAPVCPATLYTEIVRSALKTSDISIDLDLHAPVLAEKGVRLQLVLNEHDYAFRSQDGATLFASGRFETVQPEVRKAELGRLSMLVAPRLPDIKAEADEILSASKFYSAFASVVQYGELFRGVKRIWIRGNEAVALVSNDACRKSAMQGSPEIVTQAALQDALVHSAGFLINTSDYCLPGMAFIANRIHNLDVSPSVFEHQGDFEIYASFSVASHSMLVADAYIFARGELVGQVRGIEFRRMSLKILRMLLGAHTSPAPQSHVAAPRVISQASQQPRQPSNGVNEFLELLQRILRTTELDNNATFPELGVDSLLVIEIMTAVTERFPGFSVSRDIFLSGTVAQAVKAFESYNPSQEVSPQVTKAEPTDNSDGASQIPVAGRDVVLSILSSVLRISAVEEGVTFQELGVDSLLSIELCAALQQALPEKKVPRDLFEKQPTVKRCLQYLFPVVPEKTEAKAKVNGLANGTAAHAPSSPGDESPLIAPSTQFDTAVTQLSRQPSIPILTTLQTSSSSAQRSLVLIHDGSGTAASYAALPSLSRAVYGVSNPHFRSGGSIGGIVTAAELYATQIREIARTKPVILGGWSMGGVIAYELACRYPGLVQGVILIDAPPIGLRHMRRATIPDFGTKNETTKGLILKQFEVNAPVLNEYTPSEAGTNMPYVIIRAKAGYKTAPGAEVTKGTTEEWLARRNEGREDIEMWVTRLGRRLAATFDTSGNHFQLFQEPYVHDLVKSINTAIETIELCARE